MRRLVLWAACGAALAGAAAPAQAQKVQWSDAVYVPGRWQGGQLVRGTTRNGAADSLALVMRVDYFASPPRWRAEIARTRNGRTFGEPDVLIGQGANVQVVTALGATPLAQHLLGRDSLVLAAVAALDAQGRRRGAANGRLVDHGPDGSVQRVVFRRTARAAEFSDDLLNARAGGGRQFLASGIQRVGDQRSASVVATAGARGVDRVQTPRGTVPVNPDAAAIARMEAASVGAVRLEEFQRAGRLGAYSTRGGTR